MSRMIEECEGMGVSRQWVVVLRFDVNRWIGTVRFFESLSLPTMDWQYQLGMVHNAIETARVHLNVR